MANNYFSFKQFTIFQDRSSFKVGTDGVLLGAVCDVYEAERILEIGTGTGLIALMQAQRSNGFIVAIEPDFESYSPGLRKCKYFKVEQQDISFKYRLSELHA